MGRTGYPKLTNNYHGSICDTQNTNNKWLSKLNHLTISNLCQEREKVTHGFDASKEEQINGPALTNIHKVNTNTHISSKMYSNNAYTNLPMFLL